MIPKIFNFVWLDRGREFGYLEYMSIWTKMIIYKDTHKYILWTDNMSVSLYNKDELIKHGLVIKNLTKYVDKIPEELIEMYGVNLATSVEADYYKFQIMNLMGGIYSDVDSITIKPMEDQLYTHQFVSCIEPVPGTNYPGGVVQGFFLTEPNSSYFYRYFYIRRHIKFKYVPSMAIGLLCLDAEGVYLVNHKKFIPISWEKTELGNWLNSDSKISDFSLDNEICEFHAYREAINNVDNGLELLMKKLSEYEDYLTQKFV